MKSSVRIVLLFVAFTTVWASNESAHAADEAALALVEKGIEAQGGRAKLSEYPAATVKMKGTIHANGMALPYTGDVWTQNADQQKFVIELDINGQKLRVTHVLNRDKGWTQIADITMEFDQEKLVEAQETAHAEYVSRLVPLRDKEFTVVSAGESTVGNRPAVGVTVSKQGRRDSSLYFDKQTGLLVKTETRVKDEMTRQEMTQETFLSDYKDFDGSKHAMKFVIHRDGKLFMDGELSDLMGSKKLDDSEFARP